MRKAIVRIGGLVAASAALTLASASFALASPASPAGRTVTGPEVVTGAVHGAAALANTPHIPLTFAGVVPTTDSGFVLGNGGGNAHTLTTPAGKLNITGLGSKSATQTASPKTCWFTYTVTQQFKFTSGTGKFTGASGPGAYQIFFGAYAPRFTSGTHKGQCNFSNSAQPLAKGAIATFLAAGVLTVA